jgi:phage-related protein
MAGRNIQGAVNRCRGRALSHHGEGIFYLYKSWDNCVKLVVWLGDSRFRVREFSPDAMHEAGVQLGRVQLGKDPVDWKPMPSVGLGVREIRVRVGGVFRVIYVAKFLEAVYVLHAFQKKSRKTAQADIELARHRFRTLIRERRR